ncbi:MAG: GTPase ObgE [Bacteroidetes bacterium 4572_77]|nr:MAG: GTPase ObgE [Bacteroidetes bacterium 4572_77]
MEMIGSDTETTIEETTDDVPKGGPDGGDGGKGGDVVFLGNRNVGTLLDLRYTREFIAEKGVNGDKARKTGRYGKSKIVNVPVGTVVKNAETEEIIYDISEEGQREVVAKGGIGGKGNSNFATPTNRVPRYAQPGKPGVEMRVHLELKLIADVGLVGFPNVGKSTLISVLSSAKPKIADYPFTTLVPNLGIVRAADYKTFVIADIPGIIEGAAQGKGLGIQFLRHIERTKMLVFLIDCNTEDPLADYETLNNELNSYSDLMKLKDRIICFSKTDTITEERIAELKEIDFGQYTQLLISSVAHKNMDILKQTIMKKLGM